MIDALPDPLTPAGCDLRNFDGFLLNVERLLASELWALATPEEFKCAVALWCRAWKQVPCASLPDDDAILASYSGAGRRWLKVKSMALRGFQKCNDGRLYHATLAEDALRAMGAKEKNALRTKKATEARKKTNRDVDRDGHRDVDRNGHRDVDRNVGAEGNVTRSQYSTVQRKKESKNITTTVSDASAREPRAVLLPLDRLAGILKIDHATLHRRPKFAEFPGIFHDWKTAGCDPESDIWPTIERLAKRSKDIGSPRFFEAAIFKARDDRAASEPTELERWTKRVEGYYLDGFWHEQWGPEPAQPGCLAPAELLKSNAA